MSTQMQPSPSRSVLRRRWVDPGDWVTLEEFWNAQGTAFFRRPADARIRVRYGFGWFGTSSQEQTLDGEEYRKLVVGKAGITRARMQIRVPRRTEVKYEVHGGGVAVKFPKRRF